MNNISLQQILYFKIAMKCSSFSQAAKLAYTTQSTISKNIAALEKIIGEPLFSRQKKGIMPTQRAILLNLELTEIYDKLDLLLNDSHQSKQERVSIGFCQSIDFSSSIPEFFSLFRRENYIPTAVIKLQCCENTDVVNGVLDGSIDLGFILSDTNISNPNIKLHTIFSVNSPLNKNGLTINDFADYPIVTTKYLIEKNDYRMINLLPFTPKGIEIVKSYDDIPIYLATGLYITLLRPYVNLANNKNIMSYKLPDSYQYRQGITMIWFNHNKNKYLKRILSILYRTDEQNESNRNTKRKSPEIL